MLLTSEDRKVTSSGLAQVSRATIKTSPKIFSFFEKQTYSNVPRTICRELVSNAVDSHVMAGKPDVPVEVWLPTLLDPTYKVRDQGLGMSHDFVMNEFMTYADGSTKDGSNLAIGGFGIGSKSPFAYTDQFTLRSTFEGIESVYSIFKDEEGIPACGLLGQRATTEPNGVSVEFPVKPEDFETFEEAAFESLRYFEPLPEIKNASVGKFAPPEYVSRGKGWGMRESAGPLQIIMGGVMYPVSVDNLTYKFPSDSPARKLLKYGLDLRLPIGTCTVALSREALSYDDRTIDAIRVACEDVIDEVAASFATMFDKYETEWAASVALHREVGGNGYGERATFLKDHALWRGQELDIKMDFPTTGKNSEGHPRHGYQIATIEGRYDRRGRGGRIKPVGPIKVEHPASHGFVPGKIEYLVIDDLEQKPKFKANRKIKEFVEENAVNAVLVIRPNEWLGDEAPTAEAITKAFGVPADQVILTSSLPEPIMERGYSRKMSDRPKVRMFTYNGAHQEYNWRTGGPPLRIAPEREGVTEIPYADQPAEGILVVMDNFVPRVDIHNIVDSGLLFWSELKFVNSADAKKLGKQNWTDPQTEFERRKKAKLAVYPDLAKRLAVADRPDLRTVFELFRNNPEIDFTSRKPLGTIFKIYKKYVEPLDAEQRKLARFVEAKLPRDVKPEELMTKLKERQSKAWRLMQLLPRTLDEEDTKLFLENL
jgi:hypothetical protein